MNLETFEEDLSHFSDTEQSFDFDCWVEEELFGVLPSDEVHSYDFDLWVEEDFLKLLETFEVDLSSTDEVHSFDFDFHLQRHQL